MSSGIPVGGRRLVAMVIVAVLLLASFGAAVAVAAPAPPPPLPDGCIPTCGSRSGVSSVATNTVTRGVSMTITYSGPAIDFEHPTRCGELGCAYHRLTWSASDPAAFTLGANCTPTSMSCTVTYNPPYAGDSGETWAFVYADHTDGIFPVNLRAYGFYTPPTLYSVRLDAVDTSGRSIGLTSGAKVYAVRQGANPVEADCVGWRWFDTVLRDRTITAPSCVTIQHTSGYSHTNAYSGILPNDSGTWTVVGLPAGSATAPLLSRPAAYRRLLITPAANDIHVPIVREYRPQLSVDVQVEKSTMALGTTQQATIVVRSINGDVGSLSGLRFGSSDLVSIVGGDSALAVVGPVETIPSTGFTLATAQLRTFVVTLRAVGLGVNGVAATVQGSDDLGESVSARDQELVTVTYVPPPPPPPPGTDPDAPKPPVVVTARDGGPNDPNADGVSGYVEGAPGSRVVVSLVTSAASPCSRQMTGAGTQLVGSIPVTIGSDGKGSFSRSRGLTSGWSVYGVTTLGAKVSAVGDCTTVTAPGAVLLRISDASVGEGTSTTGTTPVTLTVSLSEPASTPVTVQVASANGTAATGVDAATSPDDYVALPPQTVAFAAGEQTRTVTVQVARDALDERDERFLVDLSAPVNAAVAPIDGSANDGQAVVTIRDDDGPRISVSDVSAPEGTTTSGYSVFRFVIGLSAASPQSVSVRYGTGVAPALNGVDRAAAPADFTAVAPAAASSLVTFAPGELTREVTVSVRQDSLVERDERFAVNLSAPANGMLVAPGATATATDSQGIGRIRDDDTRPTARISNATVTEGTGTGTTPARLTVSLSRPYGRQVTVRFATADSTAKAGTGTTGDYVRVAASATTSLVTFAPGVTSQTISVQVRRDARDEASERFYVNLSSPVNARLIAVNGTTGDLRGNVTITDDD